MIQGDNIPKISHINSRINIDMHHFSNSLVNGAVNISLKIVLGVGQNKWEVKWAGVLDEPNGNTSPIQTQAHVEVQPESKVISSDGAPRAAEPVRIVRPNTSQDYVSKPDPITKRVWRPRVNGFQNTQVTFEAASRSNSTRPDLELVSVHSCDTESQTSNLSSLIPTSPIEVLPIVEIKQGFGEVDRSWGLSSDSFLDLRDGRHLRILMDLRNLRADSQLKVEAITLKLTQWVSSHWEVTESGDGEDDSEWGLESTKGGSNMAGVDLDNSVLTIPMRPVNNLTLVEADGGEALHSELFKHLALSTEGTDGRVCVEHDESEPIRVEPLVVVLPLGLEVRSSDTDRNFGVKPLDWVQRKQKGVGKVLGASYEGYEQAATKLLMDIEARHLQRKANLADLRRPPSSGRKCSRELKGLGSSINYEGRHSREAKGKGKAQGGAVVV